MQESNQEIEGEGPHIHAQIIPPPKSPLLSPPFCAAVIIGDARFSSTQKKKFLRPLCPNGRAQFFFPERKEEHFLFPPPSFILGTSWVIGIVGRWLRSSCGGGGRGRPINPAVGSQHQRQVAADISGGRTGRHFSGLCPRDVERKKHQKKRATKNRARKFTKPNGLHTAQQKKPCRKANCKLGSNSQDPSAARGQSNLAIAQESRILINICHRKRAK